MSKSRKRVSKSRRRRKLFAKIHHKELERKAIEQVELMIVAERKLAGKRPLLKAKLRKKALKFHNKIHLG